VQNLFLGDVLINVSLNAAGACYIAFLPGTGNTGTLILVDDAGDAGGPYAGIISVPGSGSASNSQCTISASGSSVSTSGGALQLTLAVNFTPAFSGNRIIYAAIANKAGQNSSWQAVGTVAVQ
jgi:hypothetical protein